MRGLPGGLPGDRTGSGRVRGPGELRHPLLPAASPRQCRAGCRAVEAAAQQGHLEAMYRKMYDTQAQWGEQRTPADEVFRGFAAELGLDLAAFDTAYADPATVERIQLDVADGRALGVQGTPTFFLNDTRIQPHSYQDLTKALDDALAANQGVSPKWRVQAMHALRTAAAR